MRIKGEANVSELIFLRSEKLIIDSIYRQISREPREVSNSDLKNFFMYIGYELNEIYEFRKYQYNMKNNFGREITPYK